MDWDNLFEECEKVKGGPDADLAFLQKSVLAPLS